jgi:uncharacterized protein
MSRPLPRPDAVTRPFWDGCARGVVRYQSCSQCGTVQLIPRLLCACCQSAALQWKDSAGQGRVLSYTVVHRAPTPAFREEAPYAIAVIDMDEGFRLMTNVAGGASAALGIGQRMRIGFRQVDGVALPHAEVCA